MDYKGNCCKCGKQIVTTNDPMENLMLFMKKPMICMDCGKRTCPDCNTSSCPSCGSTNRCPDCL